jgi:hypothetical protein
MRKYKWLKYACIFPGIFLLSILFRVFFIEILYKEVKIPSTAIHEIKTEMKKILRKYQGKTVEFKLQKW